MTLQKEQKVIQVIYLEKHLLYSRLHSAGQLLSDAVNQLYLTLKGSRANHFPNGQAFVIFAGEILDDIREDKVKICRLANELVKKSFLIKVEWQN